MCRAWLVVVFLFACSSADPEAHGPGQVLTESFVVSYTVNPDPPAVGENSLSVSLQTEDDEPVTGAELSIDTYMQAHGHGAESSPSARDLGDGQYEIDGLMFQMPGEWTVSIKITARGVTETASLNLEVK